MLNYIIWWFIIGAICGIFLSVISFYFQRKHGLFQWQFRFAWVLRASVLIFYLVTIPLAGGYIGALHGAYRFLNHSLNHNEDVLELLQEAGDAGADILGILYIRGPETVSDLFVSLPATNDSQVAGKDTDRKPLGELLQADDIKRELVVFQEGQTELEVSRFQEAFEQVSAKLIDEVVAGVIADFQEEYYGSLGSVGETIATWILTPVARRDFNAKLAGVDALIDGLSHVAKLEDDPDTITHSEISLYLATAFSDGVLIYIKQIVRGYQLVGGWIALFFLGIPPIIVFSVHYVYKREWFQTVKTALSMIDIAKWDRS